MSKSTVATYRRKLSGVERYSMVINEIYRYNVDAMIVGHGTIDVTALRRAVTIAAEANPGVRVRLKSFLGFSKWVDSGIAPTVTEVAAPLWDCRSEQGAAFLQTRFDPLAGGPIADVILVRIDKKVCLVFRALHAAMDGRSLAYWIQDVFCALRGETLVGGESTLTDFDVAALHRKKIIDDKEKAAEEADALGAGYISVVPPNRDHGTDVGYIWRAISIPRNVSNILPRAAVYLAQYARQQSEGVTGFTVPVDYRGLRIEANSNGNLTGYVRIHVSPTDTPRTVMQQLNRQIREYADCKLPLQAKLLRWIPIKYLVNRLTKERDKLLYTVNRELPTAGLVSMGNWNPMLCTTADFTAEFMQGIPGSVGKLNVLAVNLPHSTIVTFSAPKGYNLNGEIDKLTQDFAQAFTDPVSNEPRVNEPRVNEARANEPISIEARSTASTSTEPASAVTTPS
jgi:hypothetical protein